MRSAAELTVLGLTVLGGSVMNNSDTSMQNGSVMPELARPVFPTIRVIPSIFTEMMTILVEASVSMMMISGQKIEGASRGEPDRMVKGMMMTG